MILFLPNELVPIAIGEITFHVQPLNEQTKVALMNLAISAERGNFEAAVDLTRKAVKHSLKKLDGVFLSSGEIYKLRFENGDHAPLTDECVDELMNLGCSQKMALTCMSLLNGISDPLVDSQGRRIEGVRLLGAAEKKA